MDPLAGARALFAEALRDEQAERYADALQKFQGVRKVRDTAAIEYRIGSCYEGLGKPASAYSAYRDAAALGGGDPRNADVVRGAAERLDVLGRHVARLTVMLPEPAPTDTAVRIDDAVVALAALRQPVALDPGRHVVIATAAGATPFRSDVVLPDGAQASLTISLGSAPPSSAPSSAPGTPRWRTIGFVLIGVGGALAATSAGLLVARQEDIASLDRACPGARCPGGSTVADLESTRRRALVEGPLAIAFGAAGVAAVGAGVYGVLSTREPRPTTTARVVPVIAWSAWGVALAGSFR